MDLPGRFLPTNRESSIADLGWLLVLIGSFTIVMAPLDFLGGYLAPNRYERQSISLGRFFQGWARAVAFQAALFLLSSFVILSIGRIAGLVGVLCTITAISLIYIAFQGRLLLATTGRRWNASDAKVNRAFDQASQWGLKRMPVTVIENIDQGFTGGVVGLPHFESIVLPRDFVEHLTTDQLAVVLARRLVAVESGSRTRGILLALFWILVGFSLATFLPGAGVRSVAALATSCLGFTIWTFFGLLTLPTVSRQSSHAIDGEVVRRGAAKSSLADTVRRLDLLQDDEPSRVAWIETIFHPVPSADNRLLEPKSGSPLAWHAARMTLYLSWSCVGLLARAVHCNVGRPELWVMLPTD